MAILLAILSFIGEIVLWTIKIVWFITKTTAKVAYKTAKVTYKVAKPVVKTGTKIAKTGVSVSYKTAKKGISIVDKQLGKASNTYNTISNKAKKTINLATEVTRIAKNTALVAGKVITKSVKFIFFLLRMLLHVILILSLILSTFEIVFFMIAPAAAGGALVTILSSDMVESTIGTTIKSKGNSKLSKNGKLGDSSQYQGDLKNALESLGNWYCEHVPTYWNAIQPKYPPTENQKKNKAKVKRLDGNVCVYECPLEPAGEAGDDCSSFCSAYMSIVAGKHKNRTSTEYLV